MRYYLVTFNLSGCLCPLVRVIIKINIEKDKCEQMFLEFVTRFSQSNVLYE